MAFGGAGAAFFFGTGGAGGRAEAPFPFAPPEGALGEGPRALPEAALGFPPALPRPGSGGSPLGGGIAEDSSSEGEKHKAHGGGRRDRVRES